MGPLTSKFCQADNAVKLTFLKEQSELQASCQDYQINCTRPGFNLVAVTQFCMAEVIALVDAELIICGVPRDKLPGDDMNARKTALSNMAASSFKVFAETCGGFCLRAALGDLVAIAAGMVPCLTSSSLQPRTMSYLRWGVMPETDVPIARGGASRDVGLVPIPC